MAAISMTAFVLSILSIAIALLHDSAALFWSGMLLFYIPVIVLLFCV